MTEISFLKPLILALRHYFFISLSNVGFLDHQDPIYYEVNHLVENTADTNVE